MNRSGQRTSRGGRSILLVGAVLWAGGSPAIAFFPAHLDQPDDIREPLPQPVREPTREPIHKPASEPTKLTFADAVDRLRKKADSEVARPVPNDVFRLLAQIDPSLARAGKGGVGGDAFANEPLDAVVARLGPTISQSFTEAPDARAPEADPLLGTDATTLVAAGYASLERADIERATAQFRAAIQASPRSPDAWFGLGLSQEANGLAALARRSYERSIIYGNRSPQALLAVGVDQLRSGSIERAAVALAALVNSDAWASVDRSAKATAMVALGEGLLNQGAMAAGAEAIERGLELASNPDPESPWAREAASILRRAPELSARVREAWRASGDLNRVRAADDTTETIDTTDGQAAQADGGRDRGLGANTPASPDAALTDLVAGLPASGALTLIESLVETDAFITNQTFILIAAVAAFNDADLCADFQAALLGMRDVYQPTDPGVIARFVRAAALAAEDTAQRADLLATAYAHTHSPEILRSLIWALWEDGRDPDRVAAELADTAAQHPFQADVIAESLAELAIPLDEISDSLDAIIDRDGPGAALLANALDRDRGLATRRQAEDPYAALAFNADLWQRADGGARWLSRVRAAEVPGAAHQARWYALGLRAIRDDAAAADVLHRIIDSPAFPAYLPAQQVESLFETAEVSARAGRFETARDHLERGAQISPSDQRLAFGLLTLAARNTPEIDPAFVLRRLRSSDPSSPLLSQLAAQDLLRKGLVIDAESLLAEASVTAPDRVLPPAGIRAAMTEAARIGTQTAGFDLDADQAQRPGEIAAAEIDRWRAAAPEHADLFNQWATVVVGQGPILGSVSDADVAIAQDVLQSVLHPEIPSRAIRVLASVQPDRETAFGRLLVEHHLGEEPGGLTVDRVNGWASQPPDIRGVVEIVFALLQADRTDVAAKVLRWLPPEGPFTPEERLRFAAFLEVAYLPDRDETDPDLHALFDVLERLGVGWSSDLHEARLLGLVRTEADPDRLLDAALYVPSPAGSDAAPGVAYAASRVYEADPKRLDPFMVRLVERLRNNRVAREGAAPGSGPPTTLPPGTVLLWLMAGVNAADSEMLDRAWDATIEHTELDALIASTALETTRLDGTAARAHAELAYQIASLLIGDDQEQLGEVFYKRALELDPEHPWTGNDYGYLLLERGGVLSEADRLISIAAAALPDNANVLDSLGWVRYAQGIFRDRPADANGPAVEGAVTILQRAVQREGGDDNPVIIDHLGDALWQIGERGQAVQRWREAGDVARNELRLLNSLPDVPTSLVRTYTEVRERVRMKIAEANKDDGSPPVAPVQIQEP